MKQETPQLSPEQTDELGKRLILKLKLQGDEVPWAIGAVAMAALQETLNPAPPPPPTYAELALLVADYANMLYRHEDNLKAIGVKRPPNYEHYERVSKIAARAKEYYTTPKTSGEFAGHPDLADTFGKGDT